MTRDANLSSPSAALSWRAQGPSWCHPESSQFVDAGGLRWHVQSMGSGPVVLLVHGAGASTHTWRAMMPLLAKRYTTIAIDLPGHAFSDSPTGYRPTLPRISALLADLVDEMGWEIELAVGHSAGAAILSRMVLDERIAPQGLISFNGAFQPFDGAAGTLFPAIAKMLFLNPLTPRLFAFGGRNPSRVERLIVGTGSELDAEGMQFYHRLMQSPGHIEGVLGMMANWDLTQLMQELPHLRVPLLLIAGDLDRAVPARVSEEVAEHCPTAQLEIWAGYGHLAHEEQPERAVESILGFAAMLDGPNGAGQREEEVARVEHSA